MALRQEVLPTLFPSVRSLRVSASELAESEFLMLFSVVILIFPSSLPVDGIPFSTL